MKPQFAVEVEEFTQLEEIEGVWGSAEFASLLEALDYGDTQGLSDEELREMCLLSLQEREPEEAAALLLQHHLGSELSAGQIQNMSVEMLDEKLWVESSDMALHERLFHVGSLLYQAAPNCFPEPDAVRLTLQVVANNAAAKAVLGSKLHESFVVRLLADGMDEHSPLHRLFGSELASHQFAEAELIVWILEATSVDESTCRIQVVSNAAWLESMRDTSAYTSSAYPDD